MRLVDRFLADVARLIGPSADVARWDWLRLVNRLRCAVNR
jgi:hypothetical protein